MKAAIRNIKPKKKDSVITNCDCGYWVYIYMINAQTNEKPRRSCPTFYQLSAKRSNAISRLQR